MITRDTQVNASVERIIVEHTMEHDGGGDRVLLTMMRQMATACGVDTLSTPQMIESFGSISSSELQGTGYPCASQGCNAGAADVRKQTPPRIRVARS
jgi:hypothetical protein